MRSRTADAPALDVDLQRLLTRLWCGAAITVGARALPGHQLVDAFVAVPNAARPRFLVPRASRRTMAATLTAYLALRRPGTRVLRRGVAAASRAGVLGRIVGDVVGVWLPADMSGPTVARHAFTAHLRSELRARGAVAAMGIPRMDAHYKPTVQLFSASGVPLGFAKLGWTAPTGALVRRETVALRSWHERGGHRLARAPSVLLSGSWDALPYVVTQPLPTGVERVDDRDPLPEVARDIAGGLHEAPLAESPYWATVRRRLAAVGRDRGDALLPALRRAVSVVDAVAGERVWAFGRWHGDWAAWNVARAAGVVHVWDWEHSTACAPWGYDLLHWQVTVPHLRHGTAYGHSVAAVSRSALVPGITVPADVLLLAYLIEMGLRSVELHEPVSQAPGELYAGLAQELSQVATTVRVGGAN